MQAPPNSLTLYRINPFHNMRRYYHLDIQPNLFGNASLVCAWGRIGKSGQMRIISYPTEGEAATAFYKQLGAKGVCSLCTRRTAALKFSARMTIVPFYMYYAHPLNIYMHYNFYSQQVLAITRTRSEELKLPSVHPDGKADPTIGGGIGDVGRNAATAKTIQPEHPDLPDQGHGKDGPQR